MKKILLILAIPFLLNSCEVLDNLALEYDANQYKIPDNVGNNRDDKYIEPYKERNIFEFEYDTRSLEVGRYRLDRLDFDIYSRVYSKFRGISPLYVYISEDGVAAVTDENLGTNFKGRDGRMYEIGIVRSNKNDYLFVSNRMSRTNTYRLAYYIKGVQEYNTLNLERESKIFNAGNKVTYDIFDVRSEILDRYRYPHIYNRYDGDFIELYVYVDNYYKEAIVTNVDMGIHPFINGRRYDIGLFRNTGDRKAIYYTNYYDFRTNYNTRYDIRRSEILD